MCLSLLSCAGQGQYQSNSVDLAFVSGDATYFEPVQEEVSDWRILLLQAEKALAANDDGLAERLLLRAQAAAEVALGSLASQPEPVIDSRMSRIGLHLASLYIRSGNLSALFEQAERARARAFVNLMGTTELAFNDDKASNRKIRNLDQQVLALRARQAKGEQGLAPSINQLISQREQLLVTLGQSNPEWATAYSVRYASLEQVRNSLKQGELLAYAVPSLEGQVLQVHWLLIDNSKVQLSKVPVDLIQVRAALSGMLDGLVLQDAAMQTAAVGQFAAAVQLGSWPDASSIRIVPSDVLYQVPWALLVGADVQVGILPHARWALRQGKGLARPRSGVALGDPDYAGQLSQLPGAREEARQVASLYSLPQLTGKQATFDAVRELSERRTDLLHLATHGLFRPDAPLETSLYFGAQTGNAVRVKANDLYEKPIRARLVVLSACESALGQTSPDQDLFALQRAFFMNGTDSVVSTLWPVNDKAAVAFVDHFYENLHLGAARALRKAAVLTQRDGYLPADYGAFVLSGDLQTGREE